MRDIEKTLQETKAQLDSMGTSLEKTKNKMERIGEDLGVMLSAVEKESLQRSYLESLPPFLDVPRFAKEMGISAPTAYNFVKERKVRHFRVGTQIRIPREAMLELAMSCTTEGDFDARILSNHNV